MGPTADGTPVLERGAGLDRPITESCSESPLRPDEIENFRQALQQLREWLVAGLARLEEPTGRQGGGLPMLSLEDGEAAWQDTIRLRNIAERRLILHEVNRAFERIKENTYGRCAADDAHIPRTLLERVPYARFCESCASQNT